MPWFSCYWFSIALLANTTLTEEKDIQYQNRSLWNLQIDFP